MTDRSDLFWNKEPTVPYGALDAAAHPLAQFVAVLGPVGVFVAFKKPNTI